MSGPRTGGHLTGTVTLVAPAKLTLSLRVLGVRPDGYHLLDAEMVALDLADILVVGPGDGVVVRPGRDGGPVGAGPLDRAGTGPLDRAGTVPVGPDNLVARALDAVGRRARVELTKHIPPGGGLGGGSSDAAAILRWAGRRDRDLAAGLGADVPFCVTGGRARVGGIGEEVVALPFEDRRFSLVLPPFGVDTADVYRCWDDLGPAAGEPGEKGNDLEAAAVVVEPRLATWRRALSERTGRTPRLAGSGSTWFVEGSPEEVGLDPLSGLNVDGEGATVLDARTVPAESG